MPENVSPGALERTCVTVSGTVDRRLLIRVDIEKLMSGSDMALMAQATVQ